MKSMFLMDGISIPSTLVLGTWLAAPPRALLSLCKFPANALGFIHLSVMLFFILQLAFLTCSLFFLPLIILVHL